MNNTAPIVERSPVEATCPRCAGRNIAEYDVVGEAGWVHVVKCQDCLHSLSRTPANRLGPVSLLVDLL